MGDESQVRFCPVSSRLECERCRLQSWTREGRHGYGLVSRMEESTPCSVEDNSIPGAPCHPLPSDVFVREGRVCLVSPGN